MACSKKRYTMTLTLILAAASFIAGHVFGERIISRVYATAMKALWKLGLYSPPQ